MLADGTKVARWCGGATSATVNHVRPIGVPVHHNLELVQFDAGMSERRALTIHATVDLVLAPPFLRCLGSTEPQDLERPLERGGC